MEQDRLKAKNEISLLDLTDLAPDEPPTEPSAPQLGGGADLHGMEGAIASLWNRSASFEQNIYPGFSVSCSWITKKPSRMVDKSLLAWE